MPTPPRQTAASARPAAAAPLLAWSQARPAEAAPELVRPEGDLQPVWQDTLRRLRHVTARSVVSTWLSRLQLLRIDSEAAWLAAPDQATVELISSHYLDLLAAALTAAWQDAQPEEPAAAVDQAGDVATAPGGTVSSLRVHLRLGLPAAQNQPEQPAGDAALRHDLPLVPAPATASTHPASASPIARLTSPASAASAAAAGPAGLPFADAPLLWPTQDGSWPGATGQLQPPLHGPGSPLQSPVSPRDEADLLSARLTFASFVVGSSNELAATAARAVAVSPGQQYNPLFVHGGVGLGKTHLLHAIGHLARERNPNLRVRYVAAETYIDDNLSAWRSKDGSARNDVRNLYRRDVDLLLVDDIQFLEGRERVQEEFFHLFNALHQSGKQIVLTGDRFPAELTQLHDRLRSRFEWGLVAEIQPPDRNLRLAILRQNAERLGIGLPHDVAIYLADHLRNNVRELEGALTKLSAHAKIGKREVDLQLARSVLGPLLELPARNLSAEVIQRVAAQQFGLKVTDLKGERRHRSVVVPRMVAMYLTRKHTQLSFPEIGRAFGGRDHSTVIHACQKVQWLLATDKDTQSAVQAIESALGK